MEGIAVQVALLGAGPLLPGLLVEGGDTAHRRGHVRAEDALVTDGFGGEEAAPQDFGHVLLAHGTGVLLHLAAEDLGDIAQQLLAEVVVSPRVGGEKRGHHGAAVHLDHRLREVLEKTDQASP